MSVECPRCGSELPVDGDVGKADCVELAVCSSCGERSLWPQGTDADDNETLRAQWIPGSVRLKQYEDGFTITASLLRPVALFLGVFVVMAIFFQIRFIAKGNWSGFVMALLGLLPFARLSLDLLFGRFRLAVADETASLDEGVQELHRTTHFSWAEVVSIEEGRTALLKMPQIVLRLKGERKVYAGRELTEDRQRAVLHLLRQMLERRG